MVINIFFKFLKGSRNKKIVKIKNRFFFPLYICIYIYIIRYDNKMFKKNPVHINTENNISKYSLISFLIFFNYIIIVC